MADKKAPAESTDVRKKAQEMREAQRKSEIRTRNIIIAVVTVLVLAIAAAIVVIIVNRPTPENAAKGLPQEFRLAEPIAVSKDGVAPGKVVSEKGDLDFYFDYTCAGCVATDYAIGQTLFDEAQKGQYRLVLRPVQTHNLPFNTAATAAALQVVVNEPEKFEELHTKMIAFVYGEMTVKPSGSTAIIGDLKKSEEKVKEIAKESGVSDSVIAKFDSNTAEAYLFLSTNNWSTSQVEGRTQLSTPEFVYNKVQLALSGDNGEELMKSIHTQIADLDKK